MKFKLSTFSLLLLTILIGSACNAQVKTIQPSEFAQVVKSEKATVIDVRTEGEIAEGYIKGASVFSNVNSPDFINTVKKLDPSKTYIVYCRSGARSSRAAEIMQANGFKKVYNLSGGIMGWNGEIIKP